MTRRQNLVLFVLLLLLAGVAAWLQFGVLKKPSAEIVAAPSDGADYYIENFTSTGIDRFGKKYRLAAARLEHYPTDDQAQLQRPHIIQYRKDGAPRHIYADHGQLRDAEVLLTGNVKVVESHSGAIDAAVVSTQQMLIRLK